MLKERLMFKCPLPPSSNNQYIPIRMGRAARLAAGPELRKYKQDFTAWHLKFRQSLLKAEDRLKAWEAAGAMARVDCYVCLPKSKIWSLKNTVKRLDVKNRLKALHDCLSESLNYDDSKFFSGYDEKCVTSEKEPWVFVVITPHVPRSIEEIPLDDL